VLSGFCLSYPLLARVHAAGAASINLVRYAAKRIVRIAPPYYIAIALLLLTGLGTQSPLASDVVKQSLFLDRQTNFLNGSFWTLCVEFRWYFVFPLVLLLWVRAPRAFLAIAFGSAFVYSLTALHYTDVATLLPFMLGILAAHLEITRHSLGRIALIFVPIFAAAGFLSEPFLHEQFFFAKTHAGWQLAAFALVVAGAQPGLRALLSSAPLVVTGAASYSIYLVHEPIIAFVETNLASSGVAATVAMLSSLGAGWLFWLAFERAWMRGPLKSASVGALERRGGRVARFFEIPESIVLARKTPRRQGSILANSNAVA